MGVYKKLLEFQKKVDGIKKSSTNPHFRNKYFDINGLLEEIKPKLSECGLVVIQRIMDQTLVSEVIDADDGSMISSVCPLPANISDPQKMGSAITYMRRYSLQALLALEGEDDDAEGSYSRQPSGVPARTAAPTSASAPVKKSWSKPTGGNS